MRTVLVSAYSIGYKAQVEIIILKDYSLESLGSDNFPKSAQMVLEVSH